MAKAIEFEPPSLLEGSGKCGLSPNLHNMNERQILDFFKNRKKGEIVY